MIMYRYYVYCMNLFHNNFKSNSIPHKTSYHIYDLCGSDIYKKIKICIRSSKKNLTSLKATRETKKICVNHPYQLHLFRVWRRC